MNCYLVKTIIWTKNHAASNETVAASKLIKDRLTVVLWSNADGRHASPVRNRKV